MGSDKSQVVEKGQQGASEPSPAKDAKAERNTDSLLDVFTTEDPVETTVSKLSKEMNDLNVYSLLEEMKQVARNVRGLHI